MKRLLTGIRIVLEKKEKQPLGNYYTYRKMNPYNPLTWVFIIIAIPISIWQGGYNNMINSIKGIFKWK